MKAIMLVAGYATRLYPLTENKAKGLLPLNGRPIIDYTFDKLEEIKCVDEAILVSNHKFYNQFVDWSKTYSGRIKITVLDDNTTSNENRLGAIGDMQFAIENCNVDEEIMVLVSDNYFTYSLLDYYDFYKKVNADCVLGCTFEDMDYLAHNFAVATIDEDSKITGLVEKPGVANSNIGVYATYIYTKDTVKLIKKYLEEGNSKDAPGNFPSWLYKRKPVYLYKFNGECYDIGTVKVYNELNEKLSNSN